jgi:hypothetical protein
MDWAYRIFLILWCVLIIYNCYYGLDLIKLDSGNNNVYIYIQSLSTTSSVMIAVLISSILCTKFCYQDNWDTTVHLPALIFVLSLVQISMIGLIGTNIDSVAGYSDLTNFKIILAVCGAVSSVPIFFGIYKIYKYLKPTLAEKARAKHETDLDITRQRLSQQQQQNEYYQLEQLANQQEMDYLDQKAVIAKNLAISAQDRERRIANLETKRQTDKDDLAFRKQQLDIKETQARETREKEYKIQKEQALAKSKSEDAKNEANANVQRLLAQMKEAEMKLIEEKEAKQAELKMAEYKDEAYEKLNKLRGELREIDRELHGHKEFRVSVKNEIGGYPEMYGPDILDPPLKPEYRRRARLAEPSGQPSVKAEQQSGQPSVKAEQQSGQPSVKAEQQSGQQTAPPNPPPNAPPRPSYFKVPAPAPAAAAAEAEKKTSLIAQT